MSYARVWLACAAFSAACTAHAQGSGTVWKCVEPDGRAHYTNIKKETDGKNCTIVTKEVSVVPGAPPQQRPAAAAAPANFPKVDRETQKARDDSRRRILEDELAAEEKSLADAKTKLAEQESVRQGDEKNYQRVLDRLKPFQEAVERHERNIVALRKELSSIR
jgi:septal ring factor EnvC (AmiA/AmiB activator)